MTLEHKPRMGAPRPDDQIGLCGYQERPGAVYCLRTATWHGLVLSTDEATLETTAWACDSHRAEMATIADRVHPASTACGIGSPWWFLEVDDSGCHIDWDKALEGIHQIAKETA